MNRRSFITRHDDTLARIITTTIVIAIMLSAFINVRNEI